MRFIPPAFALAHVAVFALFAGGEVRAQGDYSAPDFSKPLFEVDLTLLTKDEREGLGDLLAGLALHPSYIEVPTPLREKALVLALSIDPVHRVARRAHSDLLARKGPSPFEEGSAMSVTEIVDALMNAAEELGGPEEVKHEAVLRAYLLAVATEADPGDRESVRETFERAARAAGVSGWKDVVKLREDEENLFPSSGQEKSSAGNLPAGVENAVDEEILSLGFSRADSTAHALSTRKAGRRGDRIAGTKMSKLQARVDLLDETDRIPRLRLNGFALGGNGRGFRTQAVMGHLRAGSPRWPTRADVVVEFENREFGIPGRLAELPVALAASSLMSGNAPASNVIAAGSIEKDGRLGVTTNYGDILASLPSDAAAFILVIPREVERDLVDFALEGKLDFLIQKQVFLAETVDEAARLASSNPEKNLQRAMLEFGQIQDSIDGKIDKEILGSEELYGRLQKVVTFAPNHASAAILLQAADGSLPERLSFRGSLRVMGEILRPWKKVGEHVSAPLGRTVDAAESENLRESNSDAAQSLAALEERLAPQMQDVFAAASGLVRGADDFLTLQERGSSRASQVRAEFLKNWQELRSEFDRLSKTASVGPPRPGLGR